MVTGIFRLLILDNNTLLISSFTINSLISKDNILYITSSVLLVSISLYTSPVVISE